MLIAVIGGGASGMMAAYSAAQAGADVTLFEKNEKLGKKLYITGKGRCNLTNDSSVAEHIENTVTNPKFMYAPLAALAPADLIKLVQGQGCILKTERGGRVFPVSDKSSDVLSVFNKMLRSAGVKVHLNEKVAHVAVCDSGFKVSTTGGEMCFDKVIIATGGFTYQATGSTGDGYAFAAAFGHKIVTPRPSLVGIKAEGCGALSGLSLKNVSASLVLGDKTLAEEFGEMLFTHTGVSGPIVLTISAKTGKYNIKGARFVIDLKPALDADVLDARLVREFTAAPNKQIKSVMPSLFPSSLTSCVLKQAQINDTTPCNAVDKEQRRRLARTIKALTFNVLGLEDANGAIITSGGVCTAEINPKNMQSKLVPGLYFCGEVIDVDALTGGFNLQIAFSTGYLAGQSASKNL